MCRYVGHAFYEINEIRQQISRSQIVRRGRNFGKLVAQTLLYVTAGVGDIWPRRSPLMRQNTEGKKVCDDFLVHRVPECDEI